MTCVLPQNQMNILFPKSFVCVFSKRVCCVSMCVIIYNSYLVPSDVNCNWRTKSNFLVCFSPPNSTYHNNYYTYTIFHSQYSSDVPSHIFICTLTRLSVSILISNYWILILFFPGWIYFVSLEYYSHSIIVSASPSPNNIFLTRVFPYTDGRYKNGRIINKRACVIATLFMLYYYTVYVCIIWWRR